MGNIEDIRNDAKKLEASFKREREFYKYIRTQVELERVEILKILGISAVIKLGFIVKELSKTTSDLGMLRQDIEFKQKESKTTLYDMGEVKKEGEWLDDLSEETQRISELCQGELSKAEDVFKRGDESQRKGLNNFIKNTQGTVNRLSKKLSEGKKRISKILKKTKEGLIVEIINEFAKRRIRIDEEKSFFDGLTEILKHKKKDMEMLSERQSKNFINDLVSNLKNKLEQSKPDWYEKMSTKKFDLQIQKTILICNIIYELENVRTDNPKIFIQGLMDIIRNNRNEITPIKSKKEESDLVFRLVEEIEKQPVGNKDWVKKMGEHNFSMYLSESIGKAIKANKKEYTNYYERPLGI